MAQFAIYEKHIIHDWKRQWFQCFTLTADQGVGDWPTSYSVGSRTVGPEPLVPSDFWGETDDKLSVVRNLQALRFAVQRRVA
jgi:hypothetical protein